MNVEELVIKLESDVKFAIAIMLSKVLFIPYLFIIMVFLLEINVEAIIELEEKTELWKNSKPIFIFQSYLYNIACVIRA